jgi:HCO3- transporter family
MSHSFCHHLPDYELLFFGTVFPWLVAIARAVLLPSPGVSALMGPVLRQVPLAVLFGVFLYMGVASMTGVQLVHRLQLAFMPVKHHPEDVGYVRRVSVTTCHFVNFGSR